MKQTIVLLVLMVAGWSVVHAAPPSTNSVAASRLLMIDPSSMPVGGGNATLVIGTLRRAGGVYSGDYKIKVFPYYWKNEKSRLAIIVSDASLVAVNAGKVAAITGTATTSGQDGRNRPIQATATPADSNRGKLKLWFTAGSRQMIFETAYHFAEEGTTVAPPPTTAPRLSASPPRRMAASRPEDLEAAATHL